VRLRLPAPGDTVAVVLKLPGESCNINCHYCYEKRKPYGKPIRLSREILSKFLRAAGDRPLAVMLHGGEPLLVGTSHMAELLAELRAYPGPIALSVQTNGMLLNRQWLDFFDDQWPDLDIGVSLDGDDAGNAHRVDFRDRPVYGRVVRALDLLAERNRDIGIITVVTRKLLGRAPDIIAEMRRYSCVKVVKFSPCLDYDVVSKQYNSPNTKSLAILNPGNSGMPGWATTPSEYTEFLSEVYACWKATGAYKSFVVEPFISILRSHGGQDVDFTHFSERKEPFILTLYPDGRVGSCDELTMPAATLGHIDDLTSLDDWLDLSTNQSLRLSLEERLSACSGCSHESVCHGGSLADRIRYGDSAIGDEYCDARRKLIDAIAGPVKQ
jgi:radical SAM protein with 4Fe4S-binding SPASM domain